MKEALGGIEDMLPGAFAMVRWMCCPSLRGALDVLCCPAFAWCAGCAVLPLRGALDVLSCLCMALDVFPAFAWSVGMQEDSAALAWGMA